MQEYISFDSHKRYTLAERENRRSGDAIQTRIEHAKGAIREYLRACEPGTPVAVEATGNYYWIVDEIEEARLTPKLVHPRKAKLMMGLINKTDKLDVHGLNRLQRNGTLPEVWIPPQKVRDLRELTRCRMVLSRQASAIKNRVQATLAKYALVVEEASDIFSRKGRVIVDRLVQCLPEQTRWSTQLLLEQLDFTSKLLKKHEARLKELLEQTPQMRRLQTLPGIGLILSAVIAMEIGDIDRFASAERLASYSGTTPRVSSSGGKTHYGKLRNDVNRYLKWGWMEAANGVALNHKRKPGRHVSNLYLRLRKSKGHAKAIGAVARHLAEAGWHVLSRNQDYRDPALPSIAEPHEAQAGLATKQRRAATGPKGSVKRGVSAVSS
jgi:transposase